ncbi:MAG TPA: UPF0175 family protein [Catalimonadaceae bacterium]|jgi:predicted HTH domain antitoxin|nr:UPF0175 family protein [Catalimonadaceae bacterium]
MTIQIPDEIIAHAHLSEADIKLQLAMLLYNRNILSFGQARNLSGLDVLAFQAILGENKIDAHYDSEDLANDLKNIQGFHL